MKADQIILTVKGLPNTIVFDSHKITTQSYERIDHFFNQNNIYSKKRREIKPSPEKIPYHQSILHFLLYYAYTPKIPFILLFDNQIIFASIHHKNLNKLEISFPEITNPIQTIKLLEKLLTDENMLNLLKKINISTILFRDAPDGIVNKILPSKNISKYMLESTKEVIYQIYNVKQTLEMAGKAYANLRWHLNKIKKQRHTIEAVPMYENRKAIIHLIGSWKKNAIHQRGFSFVNVRSDKQAVRLFINRIGKQKILQKDQPKLSDCISRVLKVDGHIRSFHFGFPLGIFSKQNVFAHAIGITDLSIPHLAEYAQYDFWQQIQKQGFEYVNDGPSWKSSLEMFKRKFRPISKKRTYFLTLKK